ncbi:MAG: glycosyltransferase [Dehalococcoidia bacterium]|nr:glycosyltransferase [Dehalococcoidia bacterium]
MRASGGAAAASGAGARRRVVLALHSVAAGGMETYCIDLAGEYARRGISVTAIVPPLSELDAVAQRFGEAGAAVVRMDTTGGGRAAQARRLPALARLLRSIDPHVVHVHTPGGNGGIVLAAMARLATRATVVVTEHDVPPAHPGWLRRLVQFATDRAVHATIAVSRRNAALRAARSSPRRSTFAAILNGVPLPDLNGAERREHRAAVRAELGIADDAIVIGSVVRLADGKGLPDLIEAYAMLRPSRPCELLLVGDGPLRPQLAALADRLGAPARFAGERSDVARFLDAMDIFALAVPAGSMSIALLEAMARGVPPVITFCGPEEAVIDGETGLGAPPSDPAGLAVVLRRLVGDAALRERLGVAARQHVQEHFSMARVADDVLAVYAAARRRRLPAHVRADAPPDPRPGDAAARCARDVEGDAVLRA